MTVPYTRLLQAESSGGAMARIVLPAPARGILTRLIVKQTVGALNGFSFDLYDREAAALDTSEAISDGDAESGGGQAIGLEAELHKIQATQTVAASNETSEQFGLSLPYVNQDDRDQRETPDSKIYMTLDPAGSGDSVWQIAYTITQDL